MKKILQLALRITSLGVTIGAVLASAAGAQEVLPKPDPAFKGTIGKTYKESKPDFPKPLQAPGGAPNVLIVILDDVGFGHAGTFGGTVATPTLDGSRKVGWRYNQFHTTALCSPTRGALLTGATTTAWHRCDYRDGHGLPWLHRHSAQHDSRITGNSPAERLHHSCFRKMAQHP